MLAKIIIVGWTAFLALALAAPGASAQESLEQQIATLWNDMKNLSYCSTKPENRISRSGERWPRCYPGKPLLEEPLLQAMITGQDYVCDSVVAFRGKGPTNRGRHAQVTCSGDGVEHDYRVELSADHEKYSVYPWLKGLDD